MDACTWPKGQFELEVIACHVMIQTVYSRNPTSNRVYMRVDSTLRNVCPSAPFFQASHGHQPESLPCAALSPAAWSSARWASMVTPTLTLTLALAPVLVRDQLLQI